MELTEQHIPGWIKLSQSKKPDVFRGFIKACPEGFDISILLDTAKDSGVDLSKIGFGEWSAIDLYASKEANICFVFFKSVTEDMNIQYTLIEVSEYPSFRKTHRVIGYAASTALWT